MRPLISNLCRRCDTTVPILQGSIEQTQLLVYFTQPQLWHSSEQVLGNALSIGTILGHTGEQHKNVVLSALHKIFFTRREIRSVFTDNELSIITARKFGSLLSKLNSSSGAVVSAQLHIWPLHHVMRQPLVHATLVP